MRKITHLIIHHTATARDKTTYEAVNEYHRKKNWGTADKPVYAKASSLGQYAQYHWFIEADGTITQSRSDEEIGWHAGNANGFSIGICLAGWFDKGHDDKPTERQILALRELLKRYATMYRIPPENIVPHRKYANKTCYGMNLADDWAAKQLQDSKVTHRLLALYNEGAYLDYINQALQFTQSWAQQVTGGQIMFEADIVDASSVKFKGIKLKGDGGVDTTGVDPVQISSEAARQEIERSTQYDSVCLFYNADTIEKYRPTNPMHSPFMFAGFTNLQIQANKNWQIDVLKEFFIHELLHAFSTLIRERAKIDFKDTVHNYSGLYDPRPEARYDHLLGVVMKPYWHYLQETGEPQPVPIPEPTPDPIPEPPTNKPKTIKMVTIKKAGEPMVYAPVGNVLIPFSTSWEEYQKDFADAVLVELTDVEFKKYKIAEAVKIVSK